MKTLYAPIKSTIVPLAAACGLVLSASAAPAAAQTVSVAVDYADLDLTSPQGQSALDKRIDRAARQICESGQQRTGTRIVDNGRIQACLSDVKARAATQVAAVKRERQLGG